MTRRLWMTKPPGYLGGFFVEREAERGNEFPERRLHQTPPVPASAFTHPASAAAFPNAFLCG
jgi:hypothetical protein